MVGSGVVGNFAHQLVRVCIDNVNTLSNANGLFLVVLLLLASWAPYLYRTASMLWLGRKLKKNIRVGRRETVTLANVLAQIPPNKSPAQPLPASLVATTDTLYAREASDAHFGRWASMESSY